MIEPEELEKFEEKWRSTLIFIEDYFSKNNISVGVVVRVCSHILAGSCARKSNPIESWDITSKLIRSETLFLINALNSTEIMEENLTLKKILEEMK